MDDWNVKYVFSLGSKTIQNKLHSLIFQLQTGRSVCLSPKWECFLNELTISSGISAPGEKTKLTVNGIKMWLCGTNLLHPPGGSGREEVKHSMCGSRCRAGGGWGTANYRVGWGSKVRFQYASFWWKWAAWYFALKLELPKFLKLL